jgi:DNA-binding GntR family transcriptional regulator
VLGAPKAWERAALKLDAIDQVMRFEHVRYEGIDPMGYELVCLPQQRFPNLASNPTLPDDLEELAQNSGVLVARAKGKVRAVPAPSAAAKALSLTDGQPVETMTSCYNLGNEYCKLEIRVRSLIFVALCTLRARAHGLPKDRV